MKKFTFILFNFLLLVSVYSYSQNRANVWYFGDNAGLDFTAESPEVISGSNMLAEAGCATISDKAGNLLFYTNGVTIWNKMNQIVRNGKGINGSYGISQSSIFIPKPNNDAFYYLFTVDTSGFYYSIINATLNNGLGAVILKNKRLVYDSLFITDKITACRHCNATDTWVVIHSRNTSAFLAYLVTENGIVKNPVVSISGNKVLAELGYMKISPSGEKLVLPVNSSEILFNVFDFDNKTGIVSNPLIVPKSDISYAYGIEFSADSKVLYVATGGEHYYLMQYDLSQKDVNNLVNSAIRIDEGNHYALQLAPDHKIYVARVNDPWLGVINFPSVLGGGCLFEKDAVFLNYHQCKMGLPNFDQSYFNHPVIGFDKTCAGDSTRFTFDYSSNIDSVKWFMDEQANSVSVSIPFTTGYFYPEPGEYTVSVFSFHCGNVDTVVQPVIVHQRPEIELGNDTAIFSGDYIALDAGSGMEEYIWNNGKEDQIVNISEPGLYYVDISKNKCKASDSIYITVIPVVVALPTAFSPNGDGVNDLFRAKVAGTINDFQMTVFDRYGNEVYYSTNDGGGWDGTFNGSPCPVESYVWMVSFTVSESEKPAKKCQKGFVRLLR